MTIWSGLMAMRSNQHCWIEPTDQSILWTRKAPILFILATNLLILANIIRILVMQVQQGNVDRNSTQSKKVKIRKNEILSIGLFSGKSWLESYDSSLSTTGDNLHNFACKSIE